MNQELIAKIISDSISENPAFSEYDIRLPSDNLKTEKDCILINILNANEIIQGNYTYSIDAEIILKRVYYDLDIENVPELVESMNKELKKVLKAIEGRCNGEEELSAWHIIKTNSGTAETSTNEETMIYTFNINLIIQF